MSILSQRSRTHPAASMPVTYSQTPPPVVEEREGEVMVTPQLQQVNMVGFSGGERDCMKLLVHQPARIVFTGEYDKLTTVILIY